MTYDQVKELYKQNGYKFYDSGKHNVNLFGIRNGYDTVDEFNDVLGIAYRDDNNKPVVIEHKGTTKPGLYYLKNKLGNKNGTAILIPGYYPKCWTIGKHSGKYEALVQNGNVFNVWRDNDSDGKFDIGGRIYTDVGGLNMHTTSFVNYNAKVGAYSAGCQVRQYSKQHLEVMEIIKKSAQLYGNVFSYALFEA